MAVCAGKKAGISLECRRARATQRLAAHSRRSATISGRRDPPTADHAPGGHAHDQPRVARNADYLYRCSRRCRSATKLTYEVCHGRSGSNSRLLSPLRLAARAALLDAHVFFLPCDAQTRDYLDEADLRGSCTGVPSPVWACTEAGWSGDASPVDVPTRCVAVCTVRGSQTHADRSIPV